MLLLPLTVETGADPSAEEVRPEQAQQIRDRRMSPLPLAREAPAWSPLFEGIGPSTNEQVRIERRIILRISPARGPVRQNLTASSSQASPRRRLVERPYAKCVDSEDIGGVADQGDRLAMFTHDRRTLLAKLEKGCSPRDFYRGFYMERSDDGKICINRDRLLSRAGAKCQVTRFTQLAVEPVD
ncbi:hypothetical protein K3175_00730 [Qipengyuania sp. GH1]|uniref:hypothetical protein n=1 Tax=Qipengyuania aestuarii TaxID=2867241 RepID=UPI001C8881BA|nr:hypothetical protein [Qipengyuania aestuarii]MBX7534175.1 hypothetical protein [Qipengyuania aestuarii]